MTIYGLTQTEAKQLLYKHTTGDFAAGANRQLTIKNLIQKRLLTLTPDGKHLILTDLGKVWCDNHHMAVT